MIRVKVRAPEPHTSRVIDHLIEQQVLLISDDQEYDLEKTPEVQQLLAAERITKVSEYDTEKNTETLEVTFRDTPDEEEPEPADPDVTAQLETGELLLGGADVSVETPTEGTGAAPSFKRVEMAHAETATEQLVGAGAEQTVAGGEPHLVTSDTPAADLDAKATRKARARNQVGS